MSSISQFRTDRVNDWIQQQTPPRSPSSPAAPSRKRSRGYTSTDMPRNTSPKRQRIDPDDVLPTQSASQVGTISVVDLPSRTIFTPPPGTKRSLSPTRALTELRTATPSICLSPLTQVKKSPPAAISAKIKSLRRREGLEYQQRFAKLLNQTPSLVHLSRWIPLIPKPTTTRTHDLPTILPW